MSDSGMFDPRKRLTVSALEFCRLCGKVWPEGKFFACDPSCPPDPRDAELTTLRAEVERQKAEIARLRDAVAYADPIVRRYAEAHPKFGRLDGAEIDPCGAHAWLARAALQHKDAK